MEDSHRPGTLKKGNGGKKSKGRSSTAQRKREKKDFGKVAEHTL
jgi:hypothetical protein